MLDTRVPFLYWISGGIWGVNMINGWCVVDGLEVRMINANGMDVNWWIWWKNVWMRDDDILKEGSRAIIAVNNQN